MAAATKDKFLFDKGYIENLNKTINTGKCPQGSVISKSISEPYLLTVVTCKFKNKGPIREITYLQDFDQKHTDDRVIVLFNEGLNVNSLFDVNKIYNKEIQSIPDLDLKKKIYFTLLEMDIPGLSSIKLNCLHDASCSNYTTNKIAEAKVYGATLNTENLEGGNVLSELTEMKTDWLKAKALGIKYSFEKYLKNYNKSLEKSYLKSTVFSKREMKEKVKKIYNKFFEI